MQEAYFGLYEAVQRYENDHEVKFMTYAGFWIQQAIKRYIDNSGRCIKLPVGLQGRMYQYNKIVNAYESQLNRKPTDSELCMYLKIDTKALGNLRKAVHQYSNIDSLDRQIQSEDDSLFLGDSVADKKELENEVIESMMQDNITTGLWQMVEKYTNETENKVINARFKRSLTLAAIGEELGITREAVRQWESKGLRKLRYSKCMREISNKFEINYARAYRGSARSFNYDWTSSTEKVALKNLELECLL